MARPKYIYELDDKLHVHGDDDCLTFQQGPLIGSGPDKCIFMGRENLVKLRAVIDEYLAAVPA
jgi:hypothetical protein